MNLNNKGFMLAEVIISASVIIVTLVSLYAGFARVYKAYEIRSTYYDADSVYALKTISDYFIDEMVFNSYISRINSTNRYVEFKEIDTPSNKIDAFINKMIENYSFKRFYLTRYNSTYIDSIKYECNVDQEECTINYDLEKYIAFLISDGVIDDNNDNYKYIFISETKDGRFSYLRIA